nr:homeobox and C2H2 transcription factor [Aspergillus niger CBS 513.88]|eukprot:XP_001389780.2 homeobox and C2H2 transcription factor [Aspergillus niger CBS 513.88]
MEYFDFDEASYGSNVREDDVASDNLEFDENEAAENYNAIFQEQSLEFPNDLPEQDTGKLDNGVYPMSRAEEPCDFCRHMNLDCFVAKSGVMRQNGCTCCISLYRECSFTHATAPGKFLDTLHPISENTYIHTGGLTGKKALKSLSFIAEDDGRARKSNSRLAREAVRILKAWLQEHWEHPYPTEQEKDELQQRTGLKRMQISNWLANARRRGKVPPGPRNSSATGAINIPGQKGVDVTYMTPMERWKHSPPENEPAATSDILRALVTTDLNHDRQRASRPGHGDWGFEPFIQGLVENAMPPYLIGGEQKTLNPFKPPNAAQTAGLLHSEDVNCYRRLQRELTAYIHSQRAIGIIPTDRMIQDEGRRIIYGSDDPWNQTCADNSTWLSLLKRDAGLEVLPGSEHIQLSDLGMRPPFAAADGLKQPPAETSMLSSPLYPRQGTFSPVTPNSGLQSPAFMGHGRSSFAASAPGSSTGSYAESSGFLPSRPYSRLSADVGSSLSAGMASLNTPLSGSVDQFVQMGFDPEFLQQLNERYDELPLDDMQGLCFEESNRREGEAGQHQADPTGKSLPFSAPVSAPIAIPGMRSSEVFMSDTGPNEELAPTTDLGYPGMHEG